RRYRACVHRSSVTHTAKLLQGEPVVGRGIAGPGPASAAALNATHGAVREAELHHPRVTAGEIGAVRFARPHQTSHRQGVRGAHPGPHELAVAIDDLADGFTE